MREPSPAGTLVDTERFNEWTNRFAGYRRTVTNPKIKAWLNQFTEPDRDVAARILDCVEYINLEQVEVGLAAVLSDLTGWHRTKKRRKGKWRFVAFSRSGAESGQLMVYHLRTAAGLSPDRYDELFIDKRDLLLQELGPDDTVVFVDDCTGTGNQACTAWPEMSELLPDEPTVYLVLVTACDGAIERIHDETRMTVRPWKTLKDPDNLFAEECIHFSNAEKGNVLAYCKTADKKQPKGYGDCGLVLVFGHKAPNDSIPILHKKHAGWSGLFPR